MFLFWLRLYLINSGRNRHTPPTTSRHHLTARPDLELACVVLANWESDRSPPIVLPILNRNGFLPKPPANFTQNCLKTANTTDSLRFAPISEGDKFNTLNTVKPIRSSELPIALHGRRSGESALSQPSCLRFGNPPFMRKANNAQYREW